MTSDKHKQLILSEEISKEYKIYSVLHLRNKGNTDFVGRGKRQHLNFPTA